MMVCLGNICRSPLAHGVMDNMVKQAGLNWEIDSAGTGDWHIGSSPDKRSIEIAKNNGIDITNQRAQLFDPSFFQQYDKILVMDKQNYEDVLAIANTQQDRDKVSLFLVDDEVPDPYLDSNMFTSVFQLIENRCKELLLELKN
ncbi:MAG: low molecular weight protein-tyrosine-phosphatase [Sphingobacterium sp.]